ncbi:hypothetical protein HYV86_01150 [Candidatus Woesearchaeota archaeon]|nr:hypothetical protein [Candidatus Woesearchaeota archaeon]
MLNSIYLNKTVQKQVQHAFQTAMPFPSITLYDIFDFETLSSLSQTLLALPLKHEKNPLLYSYATASLPIKTQNDLSSLLLPFLSFLLIKKLTKLSLTAYKLAWKDYQILHDSLQQTQFSEIIIDLTPIWNDNAGGVIHYVDGSGDYLNVPIKSNTLTIIKKDQTINQFIEYINNQAKNQSRLFLMGNVE